MKLASFKGTHPGWRGWFSRFVRLWLHGRYSHNVLVFDNGWCASALFLKGGVHFEVTPAFDPTQWDVIDIKGDQVKAIAWFAEHQDEGYDLLGLLGFVWRPTRQDKRKWFCSEAIAEALGITDSWRIDPCLLPIVLQQRPQ
jgi:hypothetical protein